MVSWMMLMILNNGQEETSSLLFVWRQTVGKTKTKTLFKYWQRYLKQEKIVIINYAKNMSMQLKKKLKKLLKQ